MLTFASAAMNVLSKVLDCFSRSPINSKIMTEAHDEPCAEMRHLPLLKLTSSSDMRRQHCETVWDSYGQVPGVVLSTYVRQRSVPSLTISPPRLCTDKKLVVHCRYRICVTWIRQKYLAADERAVGSGEQALDDQKCSIRALTSRLQWQASLCPLKPYAPGIYTRCVNPWRRAEKNGLLR